MKTLKSAVALAMLVVTAICLELQPVLAGDKLTRTYVSGLGADSNPCTRVYPCQTFAGALANTTSPGEIDCLDPGSFGSVTINAAVSIECEPAAIGGVQVPSGTGITVQPATGGVVWLQGLVLDGLGAGQNGIEINLNAGAVYIVHSTIRNFTGYGVNVLGSGGKVFIKDSVIVNNSGGVNVGGVPGVAVLISNTLMDSNSTFSVQAASCSVCANQVGVERSWATESLIASKGGQIFSIGPGSYYVNGVNTSGGGYFKSLPYQ